MIEMTARVRFESADVDREDLLVFAALVRAHEDAVIEVAYSEDALSPVGLEAYWEVTADGSQQ